MLKKNNLTLGLILGALVPILVFILLYYLKFSYYTWPDFLGTFVKENRLITFFSAWCLVANIAVFTFYINTNRYQTGLGIFLVTIVYGLGFLTLRLLN